MKKILNFITLNLLAVTLFASEDHPIVAGKSDAKVSKMAIASFENEFKTAKQVSWEVSDDFYFAHFILNNEELVAAYNEDGTASAVSRYIDFDELPLSINMEIEKKYAGYKKAGRVMEVVSGGQTNYFFTIFNEKKALRIKTTTDGYLDVIDKMKIENKK